MTDRPIQKSIPCSMPEQAQPVHRHQFYGEPRHPYFAGGYFNVVQGLLGMRQSVCHILSPAAQVSCLAGLD